MSAQPMPLIAGARCRASGAEDLRMVLDMGPIALGDLLVAPDRLDRPDPVFPLELAFSPTSALVQLVHTVPPDLAYDDDYPYYTSVVPGLVEHFTASARSLLGAGRLGPSSLVVEAASNDGYMLEVFAGAGVPVLGVDPAPGPVEVARGRGVESICDFFSADLAERLRAEGRTADLVLGNNVLNLVPDPNDFARAVRTLLRDDGRAVLEVPYAVEMLRGVEYDTIFHQNVSYFTVTALARLFERHDLGIVEVERVATFGGSLRVTLAPGATSEGAAALLEEETQLGVERPEFYETFGRSARAARDALVAMLRGLRAEGARLAAYGAGGGMATTLLGYAGIDRSLVEYAVDANPHKHGFHTPGSRLPIHPPERLLEDRPDYVLLLAWNYAEEIMEAQREYRRGGGRFVVPVPVPHIVEPEAT